MSATAMDLPLLDVPMAGLYPIPLAEANALLVKWGHKLGPVKRPFRSEAFGLTVDGRTCAVAISASTVSNTAAGYRRDQLVELARLASSEPWGNRVMLRFWRELCAPRWKCWPVLAAISYSQNALHRGDIYRFDGWEKVSDKAGNANPGKHGFASAERRQKGTEYATAPIKGAKTLWLWRYPASTQLGKEQR